MTIGFMVINSDNMGAHSHPCSDLLFWLRNDNVSSTPSGLILFPASLECAVRKRKPEGKGPWWAARAEGASALEWAGGWA